METIIEVRGLKKSYRDIQAVRGIDFCVEKGKLFAFLGPNGAGKSTTINMITTFLKPDEGEVIINGHLLGKADDKIRESIGTVFQESLLDKALTVEENLYCRGSLYQLRGHRLRQAVENVISLCELQEIRKRRYGMLSGGQRRRADIARALLHTPKILFLDEPTTGLDPKTRAMIWDLVRKLQEEKGMSIFLTTHYMEEASIADHIVIIDKGKIAVQGTPEQLKRQYARDILRLQSAHPAVVSKFLLEQNIAFRYIQDGMEVSLEKTLDALPIVQHLKDDLTSFEVIHGTMDDAFLHIIHKEEDVCEC